MAKLKFNGETYTVDYAVKGADFIHGYDSDGTKIISYDGISDFSDFGYDQSYLEPEECFQEIGNIVRHHEGALKRSDGNTLSAADFGAAEATHTHTPADIGAASADHTHTPASIGAVALEDTGKARPYQTSAAVFTISESTSLKEVHYGKFLWASSSNDIVITIPKNETTAIPSSMEFEFCKGSTGKVTFSPASGVTLFSVDNARTIAERYSCVVLKKINTDIWLLAGDLA